MILNCPRCGKPFNGSRICQNCGYQFNDTDIRAFFQDQKRKSNNNTGLIIFIVIAILLLFIVGIGFAVFVPAFVGYKAKSDEARRRQEYSQSQNSSVYKENDEEHDKDENVSDPSLTSCECEIYDCGEYQVGKDVPPGRYLIISDPQNDFGNIEFNVYSQQIKSRGTFLWCDLYQGNAYVILHEGNFIYFLNAKMYRDDNTVSLNDFSDVSQYGGMYEVGKDIEPGKYRLEKTDIKKTLNYKIYSSIDTVPPTIRQKASFEYGSPEVSISEGEYLSVMFGKPVKID